MKIKLENLKIDKHKKISDEIIVDLINKLYPNNLDYSKRIIAYRIILSKIISNLKEDELLELEGDQQLIKEILFDFKTEKPHIIKFAKGIDLSRIDFSNVSFDRLKVCGLDFTGLHNVKINPEMVYNSSLKDTICDGVTFTGSFCDVHIEGTNFTGSKGAFIAPETLKYKTVKNAILNGVTFIGCFAGTEIMGADFTGSRGALIDPSTLRDSYDSAGIYFYDNYKSMRDCILNGVTFIGSFNGVEITNADFTGSKGAKIDPTKLYHDLRTLCHRDISVKGCVFCDVEFIGPFDNVLIEEADFTGSKNADINPQKLLKSINYTKSSEKHPSVNGCKFTGIDFKNYSFAGVSVKATDFTGSKNVRLNPQTIYDKDLSETICNGVKFINDKTMNQIDLFKGVKIISTNFTNSIGARINPQTIWEKSLYGTICSGVEFIGPFAGVVTVETDFTDCQKPNPIIQELESQPLPLEEEPIIENPVSTPKKKSKIKDFFNKKQDKKNS